jgi:hypothetical protein
LPRFSNRLRWIPEKLSCFCPRRVQPLSSVSPCGCPTCVLSSCNLPTSRGRHTALRLCWACLFCCSLRPGCFPGESDCLRPAAATVEITQELNQHWWCTVVCRQTEDKRFPTEQCLGQDIHILASDDSGAQSVVFDGFVLDVELTYEVFGSFTAQLEAVTRCARCRRLRIEPGG